MNIDSIKKLYKGMSDGDLVVISAGDIRKLVETIQNLELENEQLRVEGLFSDVLEFISEPREELVSELESLLRDEQIDESGFILTQVEIYTNLGIITETKVEVEEHGAYKITCTRKEPHDPIELVIESSKKDNDRNLWAVATRIDRIINQLISITRNQTGE